MPAVLLGAFCFCDSYTLTTGTLYAAHHSPFHPTGHHSFTLCYYWPTIVNGFFSCHWFEIDGEGLIYIP